MLTGEAAAAVVGDSRLVLSSTSGADERRGLGSGTEMEAREEVAVARLVGEVTGAVGEEVVNECDGAVEWLAAAGGAGGSDSGVGRATLRPLATVRGVPDCGWA